MLTGFKTKEVSMKKLFLFIWILCLAYFSRGQNVASAEFFIDTDPGVGNGTPIAITPGTSVSFTAAVPTTSLAAGFHILCIRAKSDDDKWGLFDSRNFYISTATTNAAAITAAEFFLDIDPGVGNGTPIAITPGSNVPFTVVIPTGSLTNGFHFLAIRTKDADGKWGLFETRGFFITSSTVNAGNITAAEYFIDADPGVGNGIAIPVTAGTTVNFNIAVPTTSLANGFHFLAIRTQDADGKWGLFETRGFYISTATVNAADIVAAEFFVDTDPGLGNGTAITVTPGSSVAFVATVPTASLTPGFHFLAIRTQGSDGIWGLFENRGFYISTATADMPMISAAEYFFDNDPGPGNGLPITIATPANTINQTFNLMVPPGTPPGNHFLAIRMRDQDGNWSLFEFDTLLVDGTLPLSFLSFTGKKINERVQLNWKTTNEVNTSAFDVERSKNGISYVKIGEVPAQNTSGINDYQFIDMQPGTGINYYRLKQRDLDDRYEYSRIVRIHMDNSLNVVISPNPAKTYIIIDGADKFNRLRIVDGNGKTVKQMDKLSASQYVDVSGLPAGVYLVYLIGDNGIITDRFIRQ
jgi:hypothetical protein